MTSPLVEHRERVAAAQHSAEQAVRDIRLGLDVFDDAYRAIVGDLIRHAPEAVIAACGRLTPRSQTHNTPTEQP